MRSARAARACLTTLTGPPACATRPFQIGFGISVTQGYGLIVTRQPNTSCGW